MKIVSFVKAGHKGITLTARIKNTGSYMDPPIKSKLFFTFFFSTAQLVIEDWSAVV